MSSSVVAIGLDSAEIDLISAWVQEGLLPNFEKLLDKGSSRRLEHIDFYSDETPYTNLLTGCSPNTTKFWSPFALSGDDYEINAGPYAFDKHPPFYKFLQGRKVCVFDVPHCPELIPELQGIQLLGWGCHAAMGPLQSQPPELADEITLKYGPHPALALEYAGTPSDNDYLQRYYEALLKGVELKKEVCLDLLERDDWDLFLTIFSEPHFSLHKFWHLHDSSHPMHSACDIDGWTPLLDVYQALDRVLGELAEAVPGEANLIIFAAHGSEANIADLPSQVFLPELLHRYSFAGRPFIAKIKPIKSELPEPIFSAPRHDWLRSIWNGMPVNLLRISCLFQWKFGLKYLARSCGPFWWQPIMWFKSRWPTMKAFALPSFGDGYVRINLVGRDAQGIVHESDYDKVCDEISALLQRLINPRNGQALVKEVIKARDDTRCSREAPPDADLIVVWRQPPADMADSPDFGRIGPLPFRETGGHRAEGFIISRESFSGLDENSCARVIDLAPTFIKLLGLDPIDSIEGSSLV